MTIDRDPSKLLPELRRALDAILPQLASEGMPFAIFEGYRSPERQNWLYEQGRSRPGKIVTRARGGQSNHQYGAAADVVPFVEGKWQWSVPPKWWGRRDELAREHGLVPLAFERAHLEIRGFKRPVKAA